MNSTENTLTWYDITKDIVIPVLSIIVTLLIGVFIAVILKRKEEKGKNKQLLIETYMDYINRRISKYSYDCNVILYDLYVDMYVNYSDYFEDHSNRHLPSDQIKKRRDDYLQKIEKYDFTEINWNYYTIKFKLLIGLKKYSKEAKSLEENINKEINSELAQRQFLIKLKKEIRENQLICENMNAANIHKIGYGLDMIQSLVVQRYNNYQIKLFKPYDDKIADLVHQY